MVFRRISYSVAGIAGVVLSSLGMARSNPFAYVAGVLLSGVAISVAFITEAGE